MSQSLQVLERGSQLQRQSRGVSSKLGVTLNQSQARSARSVARGQGDGSNWALFSEGALRSGAPGSRLLRAGDLEAAIFIPIFQNSTESAQGTKAPESKPSKPERITQPGPG